MSKPLQHESPTILNPEQQQHTASKSILIPTTTFTTRTSATLIKIQCPKQKSQSRKKTSQNDMNKMKRKQKQNRIAGNQLGKYQQYQNRMGKTKNIRQQEYFEIKLKLYIAYAEADRLKTKFVEQLHSITSTTP